ncbi:coiled-coil domain-containing protein 18-like isoform X2 [Zootermopsis nevadensis]|uniref:coiled-coil domain-containing protein 18-like isoform X2 n=1 Tax=Zootermopsis nevadensis TaxID=136037 RepID=UPI000B8E768A|nr:coiled-coil domain-containing protein 18-like isoform X2 [Zootermopsis nevadensis]
MQRENDNTHQVQPVYQQGQRIFRNAENFVNNQGIQQTSGSKSHISAQYASILQAQESGSDQFHNENGLLENLRSNIWTCSVKTAAELKNLTVSTEEQKKQIQKFLEVQESREKNVSEAKHRNEAMGLELQISQRNLQELEAQGALIQDVCADLQQHCISTAVTLEKCVQAKECIVQYYDHIRQQLKADDELYKMQKDESRNKEELWRHHALEKIEMRRKDKVLAEKVRMEMDQKIDEVVAKLIALQQQNVVLSDRIRQKTAKKENLVSKIEQELQDVNEKVSRIQQMNVELTAVTEGQRSYITKLETSLQDVTNDKDLGKNSVLHLQQVIGKAEERKQIVSEELGQAKARALALEVENHELNCILERKGNLKAELISQLEQYELELKDMKGILCELQESCENKKEEINSLQEQLQAKQLEQDSLTSEYKSKIMDMEEGIESEKKKSCDMDSELQREEQTASELLCSLEEIRVSNSSMEQECEVLTEDIASTRSRTEELQVLAKEETEQKEMVVKELKAVEISLQELRSSLADHNKMHEEFIQHVTKDKTETDEELKNALNRLHNSNANYDCMVQETMILVNESRQSYVQHIEMKETALTACKNEFLSLTKQVERASAEKDRIAAKVKGELKTLEDTLNQLEGKLSKKKADNQPQAASTPVSLILPQSEQISSLGNQQLMRGILKSPVAESVDKNKQVQFFGLSSDSDSSLLDVPIFSKPHVTSMNMQKRPASNDDCTLYAQKVKISCTYD